MNNDNKSSVLFGQYGEAIRSLKQSVDSLRNELSVLNKAQDHSDDLVTRLSERYSVMKSGLDEIKEKIDKTFNQILSQTTNTDKHIIQLDQRVGQVEKDLNGVGKKINTHLKDHKDMVDQKLNRSWKIYLLLISIFITGLVGLFFGLMKDRIFESPQNIDVKAIVEQIKSENKDELKKEIQDLITAIKKEKE